MAFNLCEIGYYQTIVLINQLSCGFIISSIISPFIFICFCWEQRIALGLVVEQTSLWLAPSHGLLQLWHAHAHGFDVRRRLCLRLRSPDSVDVGTAPPFGPAGAPAPTSPPPMAALTSAAAFPSVPSLGSTHETKLGGLFMNSSINTSLAT